MHWKRIFVICLLLLLLNNQTIYGKTATSSVKISFKKFSLSTLNDQLNASGKLSNFKYISKVVFIIDGKIKKYITLDKNGNFKLSINKLTEGKHIYTVQAILTKNKIQEIKKGSFTIKYILPDEIELSTDEITLHPGENFQLKAIVYPYNSIDKTVTWESSDYNIISVDESGKVVAKNVGSAEVIAKTQNGVTAVCRVQVLPVEVNNIKLNYDRVKIKIGENINLQFTIYPENATNKTIRWESSNPNIASVDQNGTITGISEGTAEIRAVAHNGLFATCVITVEKVNVERIALDKSNVTIKIGKSLKLNAQIYPNNATNKTIKWESSNPNVASVDQNGIITGISEGTAEIRAISENGVAANCSVVVTEMPLIKIENYPSFLLFNEVKSLAINIQNNDDISVFIEKIEIFENNNIFNSYSAIDLINSGISPEVKPAGTLSLSINFKTGFWIENSYVRYTIKANEKVYNYTVPVKFSLPFL